MSKLRACGDKRELALLIVNELIQRGRIVVLADGAYSSALSPEFHLGLLPEDVWDHSRAPLFRLKFGMREKHRLSNHE